MVTSPRPVRATVTIEYADAPAVTLVLVDEPDVRPLSAAWSAERPAVEAEPIDGWRQMKPGPHGFAQVTLSGVIDTARKGAVTSDNALSATLPADLAPVDHLGTPDVAEQ